MFQHPGSNFIGARLSRTGLLTSLVATKRNELNHQLNYRNDKHGDANS